MRRTIRILMIVMAVFAIVPLWAKADGGQFVVVLDAGHGGKDPGAVGSSPRSREKDINLNIVLEVGRLLKANNSDVKLIYTRSTDRFVELGRRAEIANKAKADLFISVHTNAVPKSARKVMGVQSYTLTLKSALTNLEVEKRENSVIQYEKDGKSKYSYNNPNSSESDIMYELMQDHDIQEGVNFAKIVQSEMVHTAGRQDMGVLQANLAVLRLTYMPSVLLEVGYISTPAEEEFLLTKQGQNLMARSIYNGIVRYKAQRMGQPESTTQEAEQTQDVATPEPATDNKATEQSATQPEPTEEKVVAPAKDTKPEVKAKKTVYKVQVLSGRVKLNANDPQFKGLKCQRHASEKGYTYTYGSADTMQEAQKLKKSIVDKFPKAFVVTFEE